MLGVAMPCSDLGAYQCQSFRRGHEFIRRNCRVRLDFQEIVLPIPEFFLSIDRQMAGLSAIDHFPKIRSVCHKGYLSLEFAFRDTSDDALPKNFTRVTPRALATPSLEKSRLLVKKTSVSATRRIKFEKCTKLFLSATIKRFPWERWASTTQLKGSDRA